MLTKLSTSVKNKVKEHDEFHHTPSLSFTRTIPGGISSIILGAFVWWLWYYHFDMMFTYQDAVISTTETATNLDKIGTIKMNTMGTLPFYSVYYKGEELSRKDDKKC